MKLNDQQINQLLKDDPQKAIKYLFELYYDELCRYAYKLLEKKEFAEEIVQGVFIYLWEKRSTITINSSIKNYLVKSVKNQSINYFKSKYFRSSTQNIEIEELSTSHFTDEKSEVKELFALTRKAVDSLPERCSLIFKLSRNFGMSYKEIAAYLEISVKTVEAQITIALKRIREYLDNDWFKK